MKKAYLEALERVGNNLEHHYPVKDFNIIKQALQRLNVIENSKPSKAIECLERIDEEYSTLDNEDFEICFNVIKKSLLKAQEMEKENDKYKKVIDIIKEIVNTTEDRLQDILRCKDYEEYKGLWYFEITLTKEEFDLLKEVFKDE